MEVGDEDDLTIEQKQALALASARLRLSESSQTDSGVPNQTTAPPAKQPSDGLEYIGRDPRTGLPAYRRDFKQALVGAGSMGLEAGGPAIGQAVGAPLAPVTFGASIPIGGMIGGATGDIAAQRLEMAANPQQKFGIGRLLVATGMGAIPGASLAKASGSTVAKQAVRMGGANMVAKTVQTSVDEGRLPNPGELILSGAVGAGSVPLSKLMDSGFRAVRMQIKQADNAIADEMTQVASKAGYKVFPQSTRPTQTEEATNALVRKDIGLPKDSVLTENTIQNRIKELGKPYEEVAAISTTARDALKEMKESRAMAKRMWKSYDASANSGAPKPELLDRARAYDVDAEVWEGILIQEAKKNGKKELVDSLLAARPLLAKTYLADRAINYSRGVAEAKTYGMALEKGAKLTDEAKIIADVYNSNITKEPTTGSFLSRPLTIAKASRNILEKSPIGQALVTRPRNYVAQPDFAAQLARYSALNLSRQDVPDYYGTDLLKYMLNPALQKEMSPFNFIR